MRRLLALALLCLPVAAAAQSWPTANPAAGPVIGFGTAMTLAGDMLYIGRSSTVAGFPMPSTSAGAVFAYRRGADGSWTEAAVVEATDGTVGNGFGSALDVQGDRMIVGAPSGSEGKGLAYLFERGAAGWRQAARLAAPDGAAGDQFGQSVAVAGDWALVGAPGRDGGRGSTYLFRRGAGGWIAAGTWAPAERDSLAGFGATLRLAGTRAVVGAPGPSGGGGPFGPGQPPRPGAVYSFTLRGQTWQPAGRLVPADSTARSFGRALALDAGSLWIGAPASNRGAGAVYHYRLAGDGWSPAGKLAPTAGQGPIAAGSAIALAGADVLVGAPAAKQGSGAVLVFRAGAAGEWSEVQQLSVAITGLAGLLGSSGVAAGDVAVFGAPMDQFFEGAGYVFAREGDKWAERGSVVDRPVGLPAVSGGEVRCQADRAAEFSCGSVDLQAFLPTAALGAKRGIMLNDLWGWTDPETAREYALVGRMDATVFVDVTDPTRPVMLGELPMHQGARANLWRDIKVYKNHAFIVADGAGPHGVQIFDLTQLRRVANPPATFQETAHYDRIHSAHNIVINEATGFAYVVGASMGGETCGGALHMIDIRDPVHPVFAGCYADPTTGNQKTGYTHDAQCVSYHGPDEAYRGREICFNASETALGIADVTDKAQTKPISHASYPNVAYSHQGWLSDDHRYFFLDDEGDEVSGTVPRTRTVVWDVTDLDDPVVLTEFLGTTSASDHNLYVHGRYMYQSNYVAGLRIIDIADPAKPVEAGFFDTVPAGENVPGFAGSWSNYPYFPSGTIVVTSMREGLFVLKFRPSAPVP